MNYERFDQTEWNELLFLMPLIQTAWAHGAVAGKERRLVFEAAREDGIDATSELNGHIHKLLMYQPPQDFFDKRLDEIAEIFGTLTVDERNVLKKKILSRCRAVAESAAGNDPMDVRAFITRSEQRTINEICKTLGIEAGMPDHQPVVHQPTRKMRHLRL